MDIGQIQTVLKNFNKEQMKSEMQQDMVGGLSERRIKKTN